MSFPLSPRSRHMAHADDGHSPNALASLLSCVATFVELSHR